VEHVRQFESQSTQNEIEEELVVKEPGEQLYRRQEVPTRDEGFLQLRQFVENDLQLRQLLSHCKQVGWLFWREE
jgi:hypothetical protein